jgi:hypothetical protein
MVTHYTFSMTPLHDQYRIYTNGIICLTVAPYFALRTIALQLLDSVMQSD